MTLQHRATRDEQDDTDYDGEYGAEVLASISESCATRAVSVMPSTALTPGWSLTRDSIYVSQVAQCEVSVTGPPRQCRQLVTDSFQASNTLAVRENGRHRACVRRAVSAGSVSSACDHVNGVVEGARCDDATGRERAVDWERAPTSTGRDPRGGFGSRPPTIGRKPTSICVGKPRETAFTGLSGR